MNEYKTNFDSVLADYGVSRKYNEEYGMKEVIGTPMYMAPEILKEKIYYNNCDLYSIGVTLYLLYFRRFGLHNEIREVLIGKRVTFGEKLLQKIGEDLIFDDLVRKLLKINPKERITWEDYFAHPFFKQYEY